MASSLNNPAWVEWMAHLMGERSRQTRAAAFPPDRFYCLLDELPMHLLPRHVRKRLQDRQEESQNLYLNPACVLCPADQLPEEIAECCEVVSAFAMQGTIAWVRDAWGGALLPFWLGEELEAVVRNARCDEPVGATVPWASRKLLAAAGILVPDAGRSVKNDVIQKTASQFQEKGYAPIGDLIHPLHIAALRRYYRYLLRSGAVHLGDGQSNRRYVAYNEPVARFFHQQIAGKISALAGLELKPSYVYMASYLSGAELKKHVDREQCEYSVTLCLDFSPEPELATPWPIELDTPRGSVKVFQALGDALAYRGTRLPHYRGVLADGQTSTSIFFHYVPMDFTGSLG